MLFSMSRLETANWHVPLRAIKMREVVSVCVLLFTIFSLKVARHRSYVFSTSSRQDPYGICAVHRHSTQIPSWGFPFRIRSSTNKIGCSFALVEAIILRLKLENTTLAPLSAA